MSNRADPPAAFDRSFRERHIRRTHLRGRSLRQSEIDRFFQYGVSGIDLGDPWPVAADRVVFNREFFCFASDVGLLGETVFTFLVISDVGSIDIAAWHPGTDRLAVWRGEGFALGERLIHYPNPKLVGLYVFRNPIGWLRARRCGIVIIRNRFASVILKDVPLLVAEDEQHRQELRELVGINGPEIKIESKMIEFTFADEVSS